MISLGHVQLKEGAASLLYFGISGVGGLVVFQANCSTLDCPP